MGQSVDEAVATMKDSNISAKLEEFECSLELDAQANLTSLHTDQKVSGLTFSELKTIKSTTDKNKNKIIIRAIFSP